MIEKTNFSMLNHYLTVAYREILREPFATLIGTLTLALGLVCVVTAYAIAEYFEASDGQFAKADRTYVITASFEFESIGLKTGIWGTNPLYAEYIRTDYPQLEAVARSIPAADVSISTGDRGVRGYRMIVDPEFSDIFDLPFVAGDAQTALRRPASVVLTEDLARNLFGDADPIGQSVVLANQIDATVTGVIRTIAEPSHLRDVEFFATWDVWETIRGLRSAAPEQDWDSGYCCSTYVLLPEDGSLTAEQLVADLRNFPARRLSSEELQEFRLEVSAIPLSALTVTSLNTGVFGPAGEFLSVPVVLFALGGLILAVACINYANLSTARALKRSRDVGLRKVVGASRAQVAFQYLLESALLVLGALVAAVAGLAILMPVLESAVGIDLAATDLLEARRFYVFLGALAVIVTVLSGAYPAIVLSSVRPVEALRLGRLRAGPKLLTTALVGAQFLAASFLLIIVIVMYSQNAELRRHGLGSRQDPRLVIDNASTLTGISEQTLRTELERIPQVLAVSAASQPPWLPGVNVNTIARTEDVIATGHSVFQNWVGYDFFDVMGIPLLAGRLFDREHGGDLLPRMPENWPDRPLNLVVDRALVTQLGFASPQAAVGEIVYWPRANPNPPRLVRIIGVVESTPLHFQGIGARSNYFGLMEDLEYSIVLIDGEDIPGALAAIDAMWSRISPSMPRSRRFLDEIFDEGYEPFERINRLFFVLASMAFFISIVGLLGMAIQVATRRRHEIGVRKTLGATSGQIIRMLLKDFGKPVALANLIAWPLGFIVASVYLSVFMYRIPLTPLPFLASLVITALVAWITVAGQALRAARVRPAEVLHAE